MKMEEKTQARLVHHLGFGKGQGFAHQASQPLPQGVIPAFDVSSSTRLFRSSGMMGSGDHPGISLPQIGVAPAAIALRDSRPQRCSGGSTAIS